MGIKKDMRKRYRCIGEERNLRRNIGKGAVSLVRRRLEPNNSP